MYILIMSTLWNIVDMSDSSTTMNRLMHYVQMYGPELWQAEMDMWSKPELVSSIVAHARTHACTHARTPQMHAHTLTYTYSHTCMHTYTHAHAHIHAHAQSLIHLFIYIALLYLKLTVVYPLG
jgi:hypothetical protein